LNEVGFDEISADESCSAEVGSKEARFVAAGAEEDGSAEFR
jgi:hypothetical protein